MMLSEIALNLAFFACGFGLAVFAFFNEIKIGVQVKREAKKKLEDNSDEDS